jgi:hypothetical protein
MIRRDKMIENFEPHIQEYIKNREKELDSTFLGCMESDSELVFRRKSDNKIFTINSIDELSKIRKYICGFTTVNDFLWSNKSKEESEERNFDFNKALLEENKDKLKILDLAILEDWKLSDLLKNIPSMEIILGFNSSGVDFVNLDSREVGAYTF